METEDLPKGYVQTVRGPVTAKSIGATLTHEHLYHRASADMFTPRPPAPDFAYMADAPFEAQNLWWINFHPYSHRDNVKFDDSETQEAVASDLNHFHQNGGSCIVECTTFGGDLQVLKSLSLETKVNIVAGTGYYVHIGQSKETLNLKIEHVYEHMKQQLFVGDSSGTKCGLIGELGSCWPVDDFEKKVIRAAAMVHQQHPSVPVSIHPGRDRRAPEEVTRIFLEAGGKADKLVMCHLDRTLLDDGDLLDYAKFGSILEFDLFGVETSYYQLSDDLDMPSDAVRILRLKTLVDEGLGDRIVISHDIHTKQRLMHFGGHGYSHILQNVVPKMRKRGFSKANIQDILINTPRRWLTL
ncbi:Phosphotriesterase-related protein [Halotydeus destructor]|nr:Phosphotriesterase-related protein [Halotydeus destructor]